MKRLTNITIRPFGYFASTEFFIVLSLSSILGGAVTVYFLKTGFWGLFDHMAARVFFILLALNRSLGLIDEISKRKKTVVFTIGTLILLAGLFLKYAYRFEGSVSIGEGESDIRYERVVKGPLASPPSMALALGSVEGDPFNLDKGATAELYIDGDKALMKPGEWRRHEGSKVGLLSIEVAPRHQITDLSGNTLATAFVKLKLYPRGQYDYFIDNYAPHRFYISLTEDEDKPYRVRILRGKITLADEETREGPVSFEAFKILFPETARWAEVKVEYSPPAWPLYAGLVLMVVGAVTALFPRRRPE